jgi:Mrp family chromosome partitioning ATPase
MNAQRYPRGAKKSRQAPQSGKPARSQETRLDALARLALLRTAMKAADGAPDIFKTDPPKEELSQSRPLRSALQPVDFLRRPNSASAESYRALVARLLTSIDHEQTRLLSIAAHMTGKEAASCALNLGAAFAELGRRTLVVDADFRRPRLAIGGGGRDGGLKGLINGSKIDALVSPSAHPSLSLLVAGAHGPRATALLAGGGLKAALKQCADSFDHTIVIPPPHGSSGDAHFVWAATRSIIVVARRHRDRVGEMRKMAAALRQVSAVPIASILVG